MISQINLKLFLLWSFSSSLCCCNVIPHLLLLSLQLLLLAKLWNSLFLYGLSLPNRYGYHHLSYRWARVSQLAFINIFMLHLIDVIQFLPFLMPICLNLDLRDLVGRRIYRGCLGRSMMIHRQFFVDFHLRMIFKLNFCFYSLKLRLYLRIKNIKNLFTLIFDQFYI